MSLIRLLLLGGGAAYAYKRFVMDPRAGREETAAAEPFSTEQLPDQPAAAEEPSPQPEQNQRDTLTQPTWLDPADRA